MGTQVSGQAFASGIGSDSTTLLALLLPVTMSSPRRAAMAARTSCCAARWRDLGVVDDLRRPTIRRRWPLPSSTRTRVIWAESFAEPDDADGRRPGAGRAATGCGACSSWIPCSPRRRCCVRSSGAPTSSCTAPRSTSAAIPTLPAVPWWANPELMARIRAGAVELGPVLAPDEAYLLHRGLATLDVRVARRCATASALAAALVDHPRSPGWTIRACPDTRRTR